MASPSTTKSEAKETEETITLQIEPTPMFNSETDEILQENSNDKLLEPDQSFEQSNKEGKKSSSPEEDFGKIEGAEIIEVSHKKVEKQLSDSEEALLGKVERVSTTKEELEEIGEAHLNKQLNVDLVKLSENGEKIVSFGEHSNLKEEKILIMEEGSTEKGKELGTADALQEKIAETVSEIDNPGLNVLLNEDLLQVDEEDDNVSSYEVVFLKGDGEKGAVLDLADEVMQENVDENLQDLNEAHLNEALPQVDERNDRKMKSHETMAVKYTKVLSLDNVVGGGESFHKAGEIMHASVEEKHLGISMSCITEKPIVKHEKLSIMHCELATEVEKPFSLKEEGETNSSYKKEKDKDDQDKSGSLLPENLLDKGIDDAEKRDEAEEMDIYENGPAAAAGKRSAKIPKKQKSDRPKQFKNKIIRTHKPKEDESLCFVCYDGGDLVVCDHRSCPKVYHPLCINRNEAYFKAKGKWICVTSSASTNILVFDVLQLNYITS